MEKRDPPVTQRSVWRTLPFYPSTPQTSMKKTAKPRLQLFFRSTCLVATSLSPLAHGGDFLFDNNATSTYPADWATAANWNPNTLPGGPLDNVVFSNVAGGMNTNPAGVLTNFLINNTPAGTLNQIRFTSTPLNATAVNLSGSGTITLNQIIVSGNVQNPATADAAAANTGPWQINQGLSLNAAVDPLYNPTGRLQVINTATSPLQLQGQITTGAGGLVKDGSALVRLGTTGATFDNAIAGDILVNNGTLQVSNGASGNALGGSGKIFLNGPGTLLQLNAEYAANYGRDVVVNANASITADRSTATTGLTLSLGTLTMGANDKYLTLNSGNSYSLSLAGLTFGNKTVNIRNGLNNTAATDTTGRALMGVLDGSGTINISGGGGNSTQGFTFNTASPAFTGKLNLFEGGNSIVTAEGAFGSASVVLGEATSLLPITYPNVPIGSSGSPVIQSNPWSVLLKYQANNATTGSITVNGASQINLGVIPGAGDKFTLRPYAIMQGNASELTGLDVSPAGNLILPPSHAVISHEANDGSEPANLPFTASHFYGISANLNTSLTVGSGTPWKGVSNDRFARTLGGGGTTLTVNGGDDNPATSEVSLAGLNQFTLTLLNTAGDTFASTSGQKFTIAIEGYGSAFNGLGAGASPGGTILIGRAAIDNGLAANVDAINVNSGNLQFNTAFGLGGVPVNINNNAGLDIAGAVGNALDGVINVNSGGTLVLNDATLLTAPATNTVTINSGGRLHITGAAAPANLLTASTQPITFAGTGHTVRVATDNVAELDARVPNQGAIWEIASNGTSNNVANIWGTSFAVNSGRTVIQTAGLSTDGGVFTNDNGGTRFLNAPLNVTGTGNIFAASTGTSLVFNDTTTNTPVSVGGGTLPVQIGSLTPINNLTKTHNPVAVQNNDGVFENTHNGSPQIIFSNGLKSGTVNLVTGSLGLDGPAANTAITGDINMGDGSRLYLGDGGNLAFGNGATGAAPRRGDLTPSLIAGTVTTGKINIGTNCRVEMGVDQTDAAVPSGGRAQVQQAFSVAANADLMDTDRRNIWVNRSAGATVLGVDLNTITLGANSNLCIQEANTDVRASLNLSGDATVAGFAGGTGCFDLKNVSGTGNLKIGRPDMPFSAVGLYGSINAGVAVSSVYGRFEVREGATVPAGFVFTDNAVNARALQSDQNAAPTGINTGSDHTFSIWKGQTGAGGTNLTTGTYNMTTANNAAGLYVDDVASGSPLVNDIQAGITLAAPGTVVFSARGNTDAAVNGTSRIKDVNLNATHALLATRDLTDLEVGNLNISTSAVVKVAGARTNGAGAVRIGNVAAAANHVHFQDGRATLTGNVTSGKLTAGGTSLEFNPGAAGTATIAASAVQVNSMLAAKSGTVNFGSTELTSLPAGTKVGGLLEGVIVGNAGNLTSPNPALTAATANLYDTSNTGIRLDPRAGQNNYSDDNATVTNDTARGWSRNQTWVYSGEIFDADGVFTLAENIDDNTQILIDGVIVQVSNGVLTGGTGTTLQAPYNVWATVTNTASRDGLTGSFLQAITGAGDIGSGVANTVGANLNPSGGVTNFGMGPDNDGWHTIEIRMGNGSGGAGAAVANGWGNYFGLGLNKDGGTSFFGTDYTKPIDNGGMNLFRTTTIAEGNVDVDNGATVNAGNLNHIGLLTLGRNGAAGSPVINLAAATTGDVVKIEVPATAADTSSLNLVSASGKLISSQLNVAPAETLDVNATGSGELEVTAASTLAGNTTAAVILKGGRLRLSNADGSALGDAGLSLDAGTLTGTGITTGSVLAKAGSVVAPGTNAGTLGLGDTTLEDNAVVEWEVSDWNGSAGTGYDTIAAAALRFTPGAGTVTLKVRQLALTNFANVPKSFTLATAAGTITDFSPAKFLLDTTGFTAGPGTWAVAQSGNSILLNYTGAAGGSAYDDWAAAKGLTGGDIATSADPDKDSSINLVEFALNSEPKSGTDSGKVRVAIANLSGADYLTMTLPVRTGITFAGSTEQVGSGSGVRYRMQGGNSLNLWTAPVGEVTPALAAGLPALDVGWSYRTFRITTPVSGSPQNYIRAKIEAP